MAASLLWFFPRDGGFAARRTAEHETSPIVSAKSPPKAPVLETGDGSAPILLAGNLAPLSKISSVAFRGGAAEGRAPKISGRVTAIDPELNIDLGSTDGLERGSEVQILREGRPLGSARITTVFADRARAEILGGAKPAAGDEVRVPARIHLDALWEQAGALTATGDFAGARRVAEATLQAAPAQWKQLAMEHLAAAEYRAGDSKAALKSYQQATQFPLVPANVWEAVGLLSALQSDWATARQAFANAEPLIAHDAPARARVLNNLGVVAEMQGDSSQARDLYRQAMAPSGPADQRDAIQKNQRRLR
jgi:hypothetical protein